MQQEAQENGPQEALKQHENYHSSSHSPEDLPPKQIGEASVQAQVPMRPETVMSGAQSQAPNFVSMSNHNNAERHNTSHNDIAKQEVNAFSGVQQQPFQNVSQDAFARNIAMLQSLGGQPVAQMPLKLEQNHQPQL